MRFHFDSANRDYRLVDQGERVIADAGRFLRSLDVRGLSDRTIRSYGFDLLVIYRWLKKRKRRFSKSLNHADLEAFIATEKLRGARPSSINRRLTTFEIYYRYCFGGEMRRATRVSYPSPYYKGAGRDKRLGLFRRKKPVGLKLRVKMPRTLVEPLDDKEVNEFFQHVHRYRDLSIVLLMLFCGLRSNEVLSLELENIDFTLRQIRVRGKGNKERYLPLSERVASTIRKYITYERPQECQAPNLFVILQGPRQSQAMTRSGLRSLFRYRRVKSGVARANPHRFRHSFGADMARSGVQLPILQRMLGHADVQTTLRYTNLSMADVSREYSLAMERLKNRYGI
jgi:integrase/recombinase XerD